MINTDFTKKSMAPPPNKALVTYLCLTTNGLQPFQQEIYYPASDTFEAWADRTLRRGLIFIRGDHTVIITPSAIMQIEKGSKPLVTTII